MESGLKETPIAIENIGWTLGNECPFRCTHCYSMAARVKGQDLTRDNIDRIVSQLSINQIKTVNLGGNEPLYTNGANPKETLLPYIIRSLSENGIVVGLTTAGPTINYLARHYAEELNLLNDVDISIDSPFAEEHNRNRGARLFDVAMEAVDHCRAHGIEHTLVTCGMNWNLSEEHLTALLELALKSNSLIRINFIKPTERHHLEAMPTPKQFYEAAAFLLKYCETIDLGESLLATALSGTGNGCPCGVTSFRIHSITPDGKVPVSPCVYTHSFRVGDLLKDALYDIVRTSAFREFRRRHANPELIEGCSNCQYLSTCRGGCAARAYYASTEGGSLSLFKRDPYCLIKAKVPDGTLTFDIKNKVRDNGKILVHKNYLCTFILQPKKSST